MTLDRRTFVAGTVGALAAARLDAQAPPDLSTLPSLWDVDRSVANLENAYWGVMPREIEDEYLAHTRFLNQRNVVFVRDGIAGQTRTAAMEQARVDLAALMGAPAAEFALNGQRLDGVVLDHQHTQGDDLLGRGARPEHGGRIIRT